MSEKQLKPLINKARTKAGLKVRDNFGDIQGAIHRLYDDGRVPSRPLPKREYPCAAIGISMARLQKVREPKPFLYTFGLAGRFNRYVWTDSL
jgi:hypothetical protein